MKRKVFPASGGEGLEIEDLEWMQTAAKEAVNGLATLLGTSGTYIISGVVDNGTTISDGWIFHNGELLRFVGGDSHGTVSIVDEEINAGEGDWEKYATPGLGGSEEIAFSSMVSIPYYTKDQANNNAQNSIDASKLRGSDGYTRAEANDNAQNSIDATKFAGKSLTDFADNTKTDVDASRLLGHTYIRKTLLESITDGTYNADIYYSAFGNDTDGYLVTVFARIDAEFTDTNTSVDLPTKYRPSARVREYERLSDLDTAMLEVRDIGNVFVKNLDTQEKILSVSYLTDI